MEALTPFLPYLISMFVMIIGELGLKRFVRYPEANYHENDDVGKHYYDERFKSSEHSKRTWRLFSIKVNMVILIVYVMIFQ